MTSKSQITLHVYDLSQGMCAAMSQALTGRFFEGIWHTGIVVHGKEWFYGGGVFCDTPGHTQYGTPSKVITVCKIVFRFCDYLQFSSAGNLFLCHDEISDFVL